MGEVILKRMTVSLLVFAVLSLSAVAWAGTEEKLPKLFEEIRQAMEKPADADLAWVSRVKLGKDRGNLEKICEDLRNFNAKAWAWKKIQEYGVKWEELKFPMKETEVWLGFEKEGENLARQLWQMISSGIPYSVRGDTYCSDQLPDFADDVTIVGVVIEILKEVRLRPEKVGASEEGLRETALGGFLAQIERGRTERKLSGDLTLLRYAITRAMDEWKFSREELDIGPEEEEDTEQAQNK